MRPANWCRVRCWEIVRFDRTEASAAGEPGGDVYRIYYNGVCSIAAGLIFGAHDRWGDGGEFVSGTGLYFRHHQAGGSREIVWSDRDCVRHWILNRARRLGDSGEVGLSL